MRDKSDRKFFERHPKLGAGLMGFGFLGTVLFGGHTIADLITDSIEESSYNVVESAEDQVEKITYDVDRACPNKVTSITNVEAAKIGEAGKVTVFAKAKTPKGKEYDCSFTYTGDAEKAEKIDNQAAKIYKECADSLKKSGQELNKTKVMEELISYLTSVADFVEENKATCEYVNVSEQSELLMETVTAEDGSTSEKAYTGHAVWNRFFQYQNAISDGLTEDEQLKSLKSQINETLKNNPSEYKTYIYIDLESKSSSLTTELFGTNLTVVLNIEQWINEANTTETQTVINYVKAKSLEFLTMDHKTANQMIYEGDIIKNTLISNSHSSEIWRSLNNHVLAKDTSTDNTLVD